MAIELSFPRDGAVVVAGGSGVIGGPVVERFVQAGVPVVFSYLGNRTRADEVVSQMRSRYAKPVVACQADLRRDDDVLSLLALAERQHGRIHTMIYTAGPALEFTPVRELPPDQLERFLLADTMCCYRLFHHALSRMAVSGGGSLVACATMANRRVIDNDALSAMPKAAVESLVRQIAAEEGANGIRCNAIAVGWIRGWAKTFDEARGALAQMPAELEAKVRPMIEQMISLIRMQRPGSGAQAADLIAYLASDQAAYVTGQTVAVDGGASL